MADEVHLDGFIQRDGDTGCGGIAVSLDVVEHLPSGNFMDFWKN